MIPLGVLAQQKAASAEIFLANMEGTFTTSTIDDYIPEIGGTGPGTHYGLLLSINNGFLRIGQRSNSEQGHRWPHVAFPADYDVEYRIKIFINSAQGGNYIQMRSNNANADSAIIVGLGNGSARMFGLGTAITTAYSFSVDSWYTIKIEVRNDNDMTLYVDREGGAGFELMGSTTATSGLDAAHQGIGPRFWYTTGGSVDEEVIEYIKVTPA